MTVEYTSALTIALERSGDWAGRLKSAEVQPLHLLLGLLQEEEGRAAVLLANAGLSGDTVRVTLANPTDLSPLGSQGERRASSTSPVSPTCAVPLGAALREIVAEAGEQAFFLAAEKTISTDQVLLALLRHDENLRHVLEKIGLNFARLEVDILGAQGPPLHLDEPLNLNEPPEQVDVARILDAAANRAREGLRVLEDYCRFALDDAFLTGELKKVRHDLAAALDHLPSQLLLSARNTMGDVGTAISTTREQERHSLEDVARANMKRLQEGLRSLEEFGKVPNPAFGQAIEALRYRVYSLERALVLGHTARQRLADARLYLLVSEDSCRASLPGTIAEAAAGGVQIVQLREKHLHDRLLLERARQVRGWTRKAGALFIVNDRPDIARLVEADGVQLGQDDLPVQQARRILGPGPLIGVSTHNIEQVRRAILDGASYVGVGPTFPSVTKDFPNFPGLDFVRQATAETSLPVFVIGGITLENLPQAIAAGARRVAVGQALCRSLDPRQLAAQMRKLLDQPR